MIHGSALLGIDERAVPALATHPSIIDIKPVIAMTRSAAGGLTHVAFLSARAAIDADDAIDAAFYKSLRLVSSRLQYAIDACIRRARASRRKRPLPAASAVSDPTYAESPPASRSSLGTTTHAALPTSPPTTTPPPTTSQPPATSAR
eukprot:1802276-Pleurochrysis_carterae.AAC.1